MAVVKFTYFLPGANLVFQTLKAANLGRPSVAVRLSAGGDLGIVLDRLEQNNRVRNLAYLLLRI